jgi:hypothetical protein
MSGLENIKNNLIDCILATKNQQLLETIKNIFDDSKSDNNVSLNSEQLEMLYMSENDIEQENLVSESNLSISDKKWLI